MGNKKIACTAAIKYNNHDMIKKLIVVASIAFIVIGLFGAAAPALAAKKSKKITVTSSAFKNGEFIPAKYALSDAGIEGAENMSIPISWKVKEKTAKKIKSYAVSIIDLHPIAQKWVHLFAVNIDPTIRSLPEGALSGHSEPDFMVEVLRNSYDFNGYGGPNPPSGSGPHAYEITIYGLKVDSLSFDSDTQITADSIKELLKKKVVAKGKLKGKFEIP